MPTANRFVSDHPILTDTLTFFQKVFPRPNTKNFTTQLGVHVEEFDEMLDELTPQNTEMGNAIVDARVAVTHLADLLKREGGAHVEPEKWQGFLDSLADQLVTAVGCGHMGGFDILGALNEVNRSNNSKFGADGQPIFDDNQKMIKGPNYSKPDLTPFVGELPSTTQP